MMKRPRFRSVRKLVPGAAGLLMFVSQMPDAHAVNLFSNADMENCPAMPHNTPPAGWGNSSTSLGADCNFWATGTDPGLHLGMRSPRLQWTHFEGMTQSVPTTPGQTYWVSFYVAGNGGFAEIRYDAYNGAIIASVPILPNTGYSLVTGSFVASAATTTIYIGANLTTNATGDARIDEACMSTIAADCGAIGPACGDGNVDAGEVCDDGNTASGDGCNATCSSDETCGNAIVDTGEVCDDGNTSSGDGCNATCSSDETCGNAIVDMGEVCDDGNTSSGDGCNATCSSDETCGNAVVDMGEVCDDGNTSSGDGCNATCSSDETCGNAIVDMGEVCDDGNIVNGDGCSSTCSSNETCGNGVVDDGERCDDGNNVGGDGCSAECASDETCGNGTLDTITGEACDDGNNVDGDGCQGNCKLPACGDNIKDSAEICDDGNTMSGDGCNATCSSDESCGNGILDTAAGEACDDANTQDGDGCQANCALPSCGDGIKDTAEVCDDGNTASGDGCNATCISDESCGNGILDSAAGETCDDANTMDGDGCDSRCTFTEEPPGNPSDPIEQGSCACVAAGSGLDSSNGFAWAMTMLGLAGLARKRRVARR
ncbi:MAG: DUF4215 domain-containing protein [Polyangiaceae bacterium]|nr:DUF4215 domain-containing protein [Polyangiaceae bacterium]